MESESGAKARIVAFVGVLFIGGCVTTSPKTYNAAGLDDVKLATVVCKKRESFLDSSFDADIHAVFSESGEKVMESTACSDLLEAGHKFQPGKYVFVVLCSQGIGYEAYPRVGIELRESQKYLVSCILHNKKVLGIEFLDKASAEFSELN